MADPNRKDSDGDGYNDKEELQNYNSNAMESDVTKFKLTNSEQFVNINPTTDSYYGGNQSWMNESSTQYQGYGYLETGGCGVVSASNVLAYLEKQNPGKLSGVTGIPNISNISRNDYNNWMKDIGLNHIEPINFYNMSNPINITPADLLILKIKKPLAIYSLVLNKYAVYTAFELLKNGGSLGVMPTSYVSGFNGISNVSVKYYCTGTDISALINSLVPALSIAGTEFIAKERIDPLEVIKRDLDKDLPVTLMLGLGQYIAYYYDESGNGNYRIAKDNVYGEPTNNAAHYVTVTEVIEDDILGRTLLKISNWGMEHFIDWNDFINDPNGIGSGVLSYTLP